MINGIYIAPAGTPDYANEFLEVLAIPNSIKELGMVDLRINAVDNKLGWKKQKERTSSEPSTLGLNHHYKTACLDNNLNKIDTFLRDTPLTLGFSPTAWQRITNMQILKRSLEFQVDTRSVFNLWMQNRTWQTKT